MKTDNCGNKEMVIMPNGVMSKNLTLNGLMPNGFTPKDQLPAQPEQKEPIHIDSSIINPGFILEIVLRPTLNFSN